MKNDRRHWLLTPLLLAAVGCSVPEKEFLVEAINDKGNAVKCLVVIDYQWPAEGTKVPVHYTPATIRLRFDKKSYRVQVKPATVGLDGKVDRIPQQSDPNELQMAERDVQADDPRRLLFILTPE